MHADEGQSPNKTVCGNMKFHLNYQNSDIDVIYPEVDESIDVSGLCASSYDGPSVFEYMFLNFHTLFSRGRGSTIQIEQRLNPFEQPNISIADPRTISEHFSVISSMTSEDEVMDRVNARRLLNSFENIYLQLDTNFSWRNKEAFIVPLKGGGIVAKLLNLPSERVAQIEAKRIPTRSSNGAFSFGMNIHRDSGHRIKSTEDAKLFMSGLDGKDIAMLEICVATGMTTIAFLTDLYLRGIRPRHITIIASAISQQGYIAILDYARHLGFDGIDFITGKFVYKLDDYYSINRDALLDDNGKYVVTSPWKAYQALFEKEV